MQRQLQSIDRKNKDLTNGKGFFNLLIGNRRSLLLFLSEFRKKFAVTCFQQEFSKNSGVMSSAVKILCWLEKSDDLGILPVRKQPTSPNLTPNKGSLKYYVSKEVCGPKKSQKHADIILEWFLRLS